MKLIILLSVLIPFFRQAQQEAGVPIFKVGNLSFQEYVEDYFLRQDPKTFDTLCIESCAFIKFRINENGRVTDIRINNGTPPVISNFFFHLLESTNGKWKPLHSGSRFVKSKFILLPVYFLFQDKCKVTQDLRIPFLKMLSFEKNQNMPEPSLIGTQNIRPVECIILEPIFLSSQVN